MTATEPTPPLKVESWTERYPKDDHRDRYDDNGNEYWFIQAGPPCDRAIDATGWMPRAKAERIERIWNSHDPLLAALIEADGCFEAALAEGWLEALAAGDIDRIRDLWERRISYARHPLPAAIAKAEGHS